MARQMPGFRWAVISGLALTNVISILLLYFAYAQRTLSGPFYKLIVTHRAEVQIIVQIISQLLGMIHNSVLTKLLNVFTVERLQRRSITLDCLKWWNSICQLQLDMSLPLRFLFPLILFMELSLLPAAIWVDAITPVLTTETPSRNFSILHYGLDPQGVFWNQTIGFSSPNITRISGGSFSYSPVRTILGSILDGAAQATAPNARNQTYRKLDNTGYTYQGRSFGVGASVGFAEVPPQDELRNYSFVEPGYMAHITCRGSIECIRLPGFDNSEFVALLGNPYQGRNVWGIATGQKATKYSQINQTSCEVFFNKRLFGVAVDGADRLITVTALQDNPGLINSGVDLSESDFRQIIINVVQQIGMVVQVSGSPTFTPLGSALISNIANTRSAQSNGFLSPALNNSEINLLGTASALESIVDAVLLAFSGAQFIIAGNTSSGRQSVPTTATFGAVKVGGLRFTVLISVINAVVVLLFASEAVRNRAWIRSTMFDYRDLKSLILGTSLCGSGNAEVIERRLEMEGQSWVADSADTMMGTVKVSLENRDGNLAVILGGGAEEEMLLERYSARSKSGPLN